mmetsp:Transcript_23321/g.57232  ORF Transcript_23321/g.57232 Transcript_23321/m.57232 type:complete len:301 (-) Transcript_23321:140-1042(-)
MQGVPGVHVQPHLLRREGAAALPGQEQDDRRAVHHGGGRGGGLHQVHGAHVPGRLPPQGRQAASAGPEPHRQPAGAQRQLLQVRGLDHADPGRDEGGAGHGRGAVDAVQDDPPPGAGDQRRVLRVLLGGQNGHPRVLPRAHGRQHRRHAVLPLVQEPRAHRGPRGGHPRHERRGAAGGAPKEDGHGGAGRGRGEAPHQQRQPHAQRGGLCGVHQHGAGVRRQRQRGAPGRGGVVGEDQAGGQPGQGVRRRHDPVSVACGADFQADLRAQDMSITCLKFICVWIIVFGSNWCAVYYTHTAS